MQKDLRPVSLPPGRSLTHEDMAPQCLQWRQLKHCPVPRRDLPRPASAERRVPMMLTCSSSSDTALPHVGLIRARFPDHPARATCGEGGGPPAAFSQRSRRQASF